MNLYNEIDLIEMARDYEEMERKAVEDAEALRQIYAGERIVVPVDMDHARMMFKVSVHYLSTYDPEFTLKLERM